MSVNNLTDLTEDQLRELLRQMYLLGGNDTAEDNFYWCPQGSAERIEDVLEETVEGIINDC